MFSPLIAQALANDIQYDILQLVKSGKIPRNVKSYAELHNHIDANVLGDMDKLTGEDRTETMNVAMGIVDLWLNDGGIETYSR